jgi:predicted transcriptional regulator
MGDRPGLSKGEFEVARMLWQLKEATVRQVHEAFPPEREIDFATVQTYLRRLEAKGYVTGRLDGRTRVYTPSVQPRTVIRETINDFVDRLFGGEALPLVRHLIEERDISPDELTELRQLIDRLEGERHE